LKFFVSQEFRVSRRLFCLIVVRIVGKAGNE